MNYEQKEYEEIFEEMLEDSLEKGLISHAEDFQDYIANEQDISNYYVMDKSVIALMASKLFLQMTAVYESAKVEYAENLDLDDIGKLVGVPRPEATYAEVECTFSLEAALDSDITIDEGIIVSTDDGIQYITLADIFIPAGETTSTVQTRAVEPGVESKIIEGSIVNVEETGYNLDVTNENASSGGTDAYTDDEYRYLLMNWTTIQVKGSNEAFENYFANFEGINSYKLIPNWDGTGTVKCIIDPGTSDQLNRAYNDLQDIVTQATEDIVMFKPTTKLIDIYATVNVDIDRINPYSDVEKTEIQSRLITAIKIFIDGGYRADGTYYEGLILGEDFIPHKLSVFLDEEVQELQNIDFKYPEAPITILDEEKGISNEITIEMI